MAAVIKVTFSADDVKNMVKAAAVAHAEQDLGLPAGSLAPAQLTVDTWDESGVAITIGSAAPAAK